MPGCSSHMCYKELGGRHITQQGGTLLAFVSSPHDSSNEPDWEQKPESSTQ